MVKITGVLPRSRADKAGIRVGDELLSLGGHEIRDVLDYRFYLCEEKLTVSVNRDGKIKTFKIKKEEYDDIGLEFATALMDEKHSCRNKCIFCFIDQLPTGMRESLYFKDDDSRLSFLHGNYITLTNLKEEDIDRIIEMHISPVNISVHTTNPDLRCRMMHNKRAGEVLSYLRKLADHGIRLHTQIVLCKGYNDGDELVNTMHGLLEYVPALESCSVVPAGLTAFREGLTELSPFSKDECVRIVETIENFGNECLTRFGTRLFYPADEFYLSADMPLPAVGFYENFDQIANGVGMISDLEDSFSSALDACDDNSVSHSCTLATGKAAESLMKILSGKVHAKFPNVNVNVKTILNHFFGESITVSGLLTGKDITEQLQGVDLGETLLLPASVLRAEGDRFLDNMTPSEVSERLGGIRIVFVPNEGDALLSAMLHGSL